jgi:hypothetical protein
MRLSSAGALGFALALVLPAHALAVCPPQSPITTIHVSIATGNDTWSGLFSTWQGGTSGPVKTLTGARDRLRAYRAEACLTLSEPIRVKVQGGEYAPLTLEAQDSGTSQAPIVFEAASSTRRPIVTGGERLTGFVEIGPPGSANWSLMKPEFQKTHPNHWNFEQLWVNGRRAIQARSPNRDRLSDTVPNRGFHPQLSYLNSDYPPCNPTDVPCEPRGFFRVTNGQPDPQLNVIGNLAGLTPDQLADVQVTHMDAWTMSRNFVQSLDVANGRINLTGKMWTSPQPCARTEGLARCATQSRLEFLNVPTALDAPGEFYLDRTAGVLLYRPFPGETIAASEVIAPRVSAPELLLLDGGAGTIRYLRFERMKFQYSPYLLRRTWLSPSVDPKGMFTGGYNDSLGGISLPAAITVRKGQNVTFDDIDVTHTGATGIWLRGGSYNVAVKHSRLFDLGGGGIKVAEMDLVGGTCNGIAQPLSYCLLNTAGQVHSNFGSAVLAGGSHVIENNVIQSGGRSFYDTIGVFIVNSGNNVVRHNDVGDFFYAGITLANARRADLPYPMTYPGEWDSHDNSVEFNRVHQIGQDMLSDLGGIYVFSRNDNSVIQNNKVFYVRHWDRPLSHWLNEYGGYIGSGIYLDGGSHNVSVIKNIVYDVESSGLVVSSGQGRFVSNNIIAFPQEFAGFYIFANTPNAPASPMMTLNKNIFFWDDHVGQGYFADNHGGGSPSIANLNNNVYYQIGGTLEGLVVASCPTCYPSLPMPTSVLSFAQWQAQNVDQNSLVTNPLFVDPYSWNFNLQPGSPALQPPISFQPITGTMGVESTSPAYPLAGRLEAQGADFGGMFGFGDAGLIYGNPYYANLPSCPPGYSETRLLGTPGTDNVINYCHRPKDDQRPLADFGGMFGSVNGSLVPNVVTGSASCPAGYTQQQVLGSSLDQVLYYCHRPYAGAAPLAIWGGMHGYYYDSLLQDHTPLPNPLNQRLPSCATGFTASQVLGTAGVDYPVTVCMDTTP